jgi:hypothetical protein
MPEFMKQAKQAVNDKTIERPARKIAMFDGSEPAPEEKDGSVPQPESPESPATEEETSPASDDKSE